MTDRNGRYLSPPDIARSLRVDVVKVLNWIQRGQLRALNLSEGSSRPRWKVSPDDLQKFLDSKSNQAASEPKRTRRAIPKPTRSWV